MRRVLLLLLVVGCSEEPLFGPPTEATCPPGSPLTYANFGQPFMQKYCTECHDSQKRGADRQGAPSFHDFDTIFGVQAVADHIDETSAYGPAANNSSMPPADYDPQPTAEERRQLGEWLACDAPE